MDRPPFYSGQIWRSFDIGNGFRDVLKGIGNAVQAVLGSTGTYVSGFSASQSALPDMNVQMASGMIYQYSTVDGQPLGSLSADSSMIYQQGVAAAQALALNTSQMTGGQQQWALIQATFEQLDQVRTGDPTSGIIPFYNSANPTVPLQGPNGLGGTLNTVRLGFANLQVIYGAPASAGSAVPPSPSGGYVPLYLILLSSTTTQITNGMIQVAGNAAYSGYQAAPFLSGLLQQHHLGTAGQAPQIDLTAEVQNILGLAHLPASNTVGVLSCLRYGSGTPQGVLAGQIKDTYLDTTNLVFYLCTVSGATAGTTTWVSLGLTAKDVYTNTSPYHVTDQFVTIFADTSGGAFSVILDATAASPGRVTIINIGNPFNEITVTSSIGGQNIQGGSSYKIEGPDAITLEPDTQHSNWWKS